MERVIGLMLSGFAVKLYGAGFAVWIAYEAATFFIATMATVKGAF